MNTREFIREVREYLRRITNNDVEPPDDPFEIPLDHTYETAGDAIIDLIIVFQGKDRLIKAIEEMDV